MQKYGCILYYNKLLSTTELQRCPYLQAKQREGESCRMKINHFISLQLFIKETTISNYVSTYYSY